MARIKRVVGGQKISMDATQAAQTGMIDPAQINAAQPLNAQPLAPPTSGNGPGGPANSNVGLMSASAGPASQPKNGYGAGMVPTPTPVNPMKQKQMFSTVQDQSKVNPTQDIMNMDMNSWKKLQQRFGVKEV